MRLPLILRFLFLFWVVLGLSGCGESWWWNQKITVEVETPEGVNRADAWGARLAA